MKIIVYTCAYNAEKTLRRTIESILSQTYQNWVYYILDNGSTDRTGAIIGDYAKTDSRIVYLVNKENNIWEPGSRWRDIISMQENTDYFTWLDADDEYKKDFLKEAITFINRNSLDIAACGSQFIHATTGQPMQQSYSIPNDLIIFRDGFSNHFKSYYQFMWTYWGKLYSISLFQTLDIDKINVSFSWDRIFATELFRLASRVGMLSGTLHKYYVSDKSVSYQYSTLRVVSDQICCDFELNYLQEKEALTQDNLDRVYATYINAIKNTFIIIKNAKIKPLEKLRDIRDIFSHQHTQEILYRRTVLISDNTRIELQYFVLEYVLLLPDARKGDGFDCVVDILASMRNLPDVLGIQAWGDSEAFDLLVAIRDRRADKSDVTSIDKQIEARIAKFPLLSNVSATEALYLRAIISAVLRNDFVAAMDEVYTVMNDEIPDDYAESFIVLAQNISAAAENMDAYVFFKKTWISYLVDCARNEEASAELDEFEQILPDDEDFAELRRRLQ